MFLSLFWYWFNLFFYIAGSVSRGTGFQTFGSGHTWPQAFSYQGQVPGLQILIIELRLYFPGYAVQALEFWLAGIKKMLERYVHLCGFRFSGFLNIEKRIDIHKITRQLKSIINAF